MSVQTNFRAEDMLGTPKAAVPAVEAKKITGTSNKKAAKPVEPVVEAVVEAPVVEEEVAVEAAPEKVAD